MATTDLTWVSIGGDSPILKCGYWFGAGHAHALAAPCDGGYVVISPPNGATESTFAELEKRGKVRAIVASNAFHNLGVASWAKRFPDAKLFAPAQSIPRVEKKGGVSNVKPLADAASLCGSSLELVDMPHYKTGEVLVRAKHGKDVVWYVTDVIMNMPKLPPSFPAKQLFGWTKSAPGLRPNAIAPVFMVKDKPSLYRWLRGEIEKEAPNVLVACHGDTIASSDVGQQLLAVLPS